MVLPGQGVEMTEFAIEEGLPYPLGATWSGQGTNQGTNFALFSANATKVEICLFDSERETHRFELPEYTDQVFHGYISGVGPGSGRRSSSCRHRCSLGRCRRRSFASCGRDRTLWNCRGRHRLWRLLAVPPLA